MTTDIESPQRSDAEVEAAMVILGSDFSARIRRPITRREFTIARLFAVAWALAWVATGVALSVAR